MPEQLTKASRDAAIACIAARQHGVLSSPQLRACGLSSSAIGDRVSAGRLHRIHRGVYAVGHPNISHEGRWMAAVLACGRAAVVSHISAARLWQMLPDRTGGTGTDQPVVHVTVPGESKDRKGIRVHRSSTWSPDDCTRRENIPVTRPARTLKDLRRSFPSRIFRAALRQAEYLGLPVSDQLQVDHTRSELEARFLALVRRHRLPQPEVNVRIDEFVVDFLWHRSHLVAELDGWATHRTRSAFEADRSRDIRLRVLGFEVVRFTWHQVNEERREVVSSLRALLAGQSGPGPRLW
jgi:very-short-patch-repair endonuclease